MGKTFVKKNNSGRNNKFNDMNEDSAAIIEQQKGAGRRTRRERNAKHDWRRNDFDGQ